MKTIQNLIYKMISMTKYDILLTSVPHCSGPYINSAAAYLI